MSLGMIGPFQLILLLVFLLVVLSVVFFVGYIIGKKSGYVKRIKETENR